MTENLQQPKKTSIVFDYNYIIFNSNCVTGSPKQYYSYRRTLDVLDVNEWMVTERNGQV
jgi:hypothetical protein